MGIFNRHKVDQSGIATGRSSSENTAVAATPPFGDNVVDREKVGGDNLDDSKYPLITFRTFLATVIASMGGIIFGYDTGQISGFLEMPVFLERFGQYDPNNSSALQTPGVGYGYYFSNVRSGLIVALVSCCLQFIHSQNLTCSSYPLALSLGLSLLPLCRIAPVVARQCHSGA